MPRGRRERNVVEKEEFEVDQGRSMNDAHDDDELVDDELSEYQRFREGEDESMSDDSNEEMEMEDVEVMGLDVESSDEEEDLLLPSKRQMQRLARKAKKHTDIMEDAEEQEDEKAKALTKSWGQEKQAFYNTDYVDFDYGTDSEDERQAEEEEEEARLLEQQQMAELDESDFVGTLSAHVKQAEEAQQIARKAKAKAAKAKAKAQEQEQEQIESVQRDLSALSAKEKQKLVKRQFPELNGLASELKHHTQRLSTVLEPLGKELQSGTAKKELKALADYVTLHTRLARSYAANIAFYLYSAAHGGLDHTHPCFAAIAKLKQFLDKVTSPQKDDQLERLTRKIQTQQAMGEAVALSNAVRDSSQQSHTATDTASKEDIIDEGEDGTAVDVNYYMDLLRSHDKRKKDKKMQALPEDDGRDAHVDGTRSINYTMKKNKGLLPSRKKEYRNPRIRQKKKFDRASKKRRSQMREAVKEIPKYRGESTGIRRALSRSVTLS
eukprot:m.279312 g.279312  ORF g.279312 m.279312 type:complete len:494 (+) comp15741_c2_seq1:97-1578(+)